MKNELITIIVPVYNVENYLNKCIDSVVNQTYRNLQIILIDDGSTDNSAKICDDYAKIDNRIKIIHQKNGGVSKARNYGLDIAKGTYIAFVDSDDYLKENYIKELVKKIDGYDLCICSYSTAKIKVENQKIDKKEFINNLFTRQYNYQGYIWNKLFKREIIHRYKIKFDEEIYYNEDRLFVLEYVLKLNKDIYYINDELYLYECRNDSAMNAPKYNEKMKTEFDAFDKMLKILPKTYIKAENNIKYEVFLNSCVRYKVYKDKYFKAKIRLRRLLRLLLCMQYSCRLKLRAIKWYLKSCI